MYKLDNNKISFNSEFDEELNIKLINIIDKCEILEFKNKYWEFHGGGEFNQELNLSNSKLKIIKLSYKFNKTLDKLPHTLEELYIETKFNMPLNNLPKNLKILSFNCNSIFNLPLDNLPNKLN